MKRQNLQLSILQSTFQEVMSALKPVTKKLRLSPELQAPKVAATPMLEVEDEDEIPEGSQMKEEYTEIPGFETKLKVQQPLCRTESIALSKLVGKGEGNARPIGSPLLQLQQLPMKTKATGEKTLAVATAREEDESEHRRGGPPKHPKGHRVANVEELTRLLDKTSYLALCDTMRFTDVWYQPAAVEVDTLRGTVVATTFRELVNGAHMRMRLVRKDVTTEDLLRMLYLSEVLAKADTPDFETWVIKCRAHFIEENGAASSSDAHLVNSMLTSQLYSFLPDAFGGRYEIFFRKVTVHSYKDENGRMTRFEEPNPMMIRSIKSAKTGFEYNIEAKLVLVPEGWVYTDIRASGGEECPNGL